MHTTTSLMSRACRLAGDRDQGDIFYGARGDRVERAFAVADRRKVQEGEAARVR